MALSFRRLMRQRIRLGMLDSPTSNAWNRLAFATVEDAAHTQLARKAAQESICLYHNRAPAAAKAEPQGQGDEEGRALFVASQNRNATLPLDLPKLKAVSGSVLLAGWMADDGDELCGNYVQHTDRGGVNASILAGLSQALGVPLPTTRAGALVHEVACSSAACSANDTELRAKATKSAKAAHVTVLVLGLTHNAKNNDDAGSGPGQTGSMFVRHRCLWLRCSQCTESGLS